MLTGRLAFLLTRWTASRFPPPNTRSASTCRYWSFLRRKWDIRYEWSAVVIEYMRLLGGPAVLVDVNGKLGRVAITGRRRKAGLLKAALEAADFAVVEVERHGWEEPR